MTDGESEENLLLVCHDCHKIIDAKDHIEFFPPERLQALKEAHEKRVEHATSSGVFTRTAVIRLGSNVRDSPSLATPHEVAETLFAANYLGLVESQWSGDFTCRIVGHATERSYWAAAEDRIEATLAIVHQAAEQGDIEHISVFAFGPIPVLVCLGSKLDDKINTRIYQKHRDTEPGWAWSADAPIIDFNSSATPGEGDPEDVVFLVSVSAPVQKSRLPAELAGAHTIEVTPATGSPSSTIMKNEKSLQNFATAWRDALALAEQKYPQARRWHLVAATPLSVSVELGRAFMKDAHPPVQVYEFADDAYTAVLEVNQ